MKKFNIKEWQDKHLNEEPNNYIDIERTVRAKTIKGKTVTLRKGDHGEHRGTDWGADRFYINGNVFDADQFDNDDYGVTDKPRR